MDDEFDLDAAESALLPWRHVIKMGGKRFATRCPTIGQLGALMKLAGDKSPGSDARSIEVLGQLFEDPAAMNCLKLTAIQLAVKSIVTYAKDYTAKNSRAAAAAPAAATIGSTSGNS